MFYVIIIGCGFGGLVVVCELVYVDVCIIMIDCSNYYLFQFLLYQVVMVGLLVLVISVLICVILVQQCNFIMLMVVVIGIDIVGKFVMLEDGSELFYDYFIVVVGFMYSYFGCDEWSVLVLGLKMLEDVFEICKCILMVFEYVECEIDVCCCQEWLIFIVIGGGVMGVEMVGMLVEIVCYMFLGEFCNIDLYLVCVVLVEGLECVLGVYFEDFFEKVCEQLYKFGVDVCIGCCVVYIDEICVCYVNFDGE